MFEEFTGRKPHNGSKILIRLDITINAPVAHANVRSPVICFRFHTTVTADQFREINCQGTPTHVVLHEMAHIFDEASLGWSAGRETGAEFIIAYAALLIMYSFVI